jgi:dihydrofolate reductase
MCQRRDVGPRHSHRGARGPIIVHESAPLNHSLSDAGLVDRYHLLVCPLLLGAGKRLFSTTDKETQKLKLVDHAATPTARS